MGFDQRACNRLDRQYAQSPPNLGTIPAPRALQRKGLSGAPRIKERGGDLARRQGLADVEGQLENWVHGVDLGGDHHDAEGRQRFRKIARNVASGG